MRSPRVILFDDEPAILSMLSTYFTRHDFDVLAFDRPMVCPLVERHIMQCPNDHPCTDLIMTDLCMPGLNGLDLIRRQTERGCKLSSRNKALMPSCYLDERQAALVDELGCAVFYKPFELHELDGWIRDCQARADLTNPLSDRRKAVRYAVDCELFFCTGRNEIVHQARMLDVSTTGLRLVSDVSLLREQVISFVSDVPAPHREAVVRWHRTEEHRQCVAGCQFCGTA